MFERLIVARPRAGGVRPRSARLPRLPRRRAGGDGRPREPARGDATYVRATRTARAHALTARRIARETKNDYLPELSPSRARLGHDLETPTRPGLSRRDVNNTFRYSLAAHGRGLQSSRASTSTRRPSCEEVGIARTNAQQQAGDPRRAKPHAPARVKGSDATPRPAHARTTNFDQTDHTLRGKPRVLPPTSRADAYASRCQAAGKCWTSRTSARQHERAPAARRSLNLEEPGANRPLDVEALGARGSAFPPSSQAPLPRDRPAGVGRARGLFSRATRVRMTLRLAKDVKWVARSRCARATIL